jgi:hypothetical protein
MKMIDASDDVAALADFFIWRVPESRVTYGNPKGLL